MTHLSEFKPATQLNLSPHAPRLVEKGGACHLRFALVGLGVSSEPEARHMFEVFRSTS